MSSTVCHRLPGYERNTISRELYRLVSLLNEIEATKLNFDCGDANMTEGGMAELAKDFDIAVAQWSDLVFEDNAMIVVETPSIKTHFVNRLRANIDGPPRYSLDDRKAYEAEMSRGK